MASGDVSPDFHETLNKTRDTLQQMCSRELIINENHEYEETAKSLNFNDEFTPFGAKNPQLTDTYGDHIMTTEAKPPKKDGSSKLRVIITETPSKVVTEEQHQLPPIVSEEKDDNSSTPPPSPSKVTETFEETPKSAYIEYLESSKFEFDSPLIVIKTCTKLAPTAGQTVVDFWHARSTFLESLWSKGCHSAMHVIKEKIKMGVFHLNTFVEGLIVGIDIGKSLTETKVVENVHYILESLKREKSIQTKELTAHREQSLQFVTQINEASKAVKGLQDTVDQIKLLRNQLDLAPQAGAFRRDDDKPIPDLDDFETSSEIESQLPDTVTSIKNPGTYCYGKTIMKVGVEKIDSAKIEDIELKFLETLIGKAQALGVLILNLDMAALIRKTRVNPQWLTGCFIDGLLDREKLKQELKGIKTKIHQWKSVGIDK